MKRGNFNFHDAYLELSKSIHALTEAFLDQKIKGNVFGTNRQKSIVLTQLKEMPLEEKRYYYREFEEHMRELEKLFHKHSIYDGKNLWVDFPNLNFYDVERSIKDMMNIRRDLVQLYEDVNGYDMYGLANEIMYLIDLCDKLLFVGLFNELFKVIHKSDKFLGEYSNKLSSLISETADEIKDKYGKVDSEINKVNKQFANLFN